MTPNPNHIMRFTINSKTLLRSLQSIVGVTSSNSVLSILEDVRMGLKGSDLSLTTTDLDVRASVTCTVSDPDGEGVICVPAKLFVDALKNLSEQALQITVDGMAIRIKSLTGTYAIAGEDAVNFPHPPPADEATEFTIPGALFLDMIGSTVYATSNDTLRPAMTGVFFDTTAKPMICVVTDSHRMVRFDMPEVETDAPEFVMPKKALNFLRTVLPASEDITCSCNLQHFFTSFGNLSFSCRLVDAKFPSWRAVWPQDNPYKLSVNRPDLITALRQVAVFANQTTSQITFSISPKSLTLSSQDTDFSNEGAETLSCDYTGPEDMKIAFNGKLLSELIEHLSGDEVQISLSTPGRAGLMSSPDDAGHTQLLMPLMAGA